MREALACGVELVTVFVGTACTPSAEETARVAEAAGVGVWEVPARLLAKVAQTTTPQGLVGVARWRASRGDLGAVLAGLERPLVVVLVDVRDPGNLGTLVRSSAAAGADAVVIPEGSADVTNPKALRASAGAVFRVPVLRLGPAKEALTEIAGLGIVRVGSRPDASTSYDALDWNRGIAICVGNEAWGLRPDVEGLLDERVAIPMARGVESLNAAVAGAILVFEAARVRRGT